MSSGREIVTNALTGRATREEHLAEAHRTLAALCRAGVPLGAALAAVDSAADDEIVRGALAAVAQDVEQGLPLHDAYARQSGALPPFHATLLRAGHESGDVAGALDACAEHAELTARVTRRLRRATAYPLMAGSFAFVIGTVLLIVVAPMLQSLRLELIGARGTDTNGMVAALAPGGLAFAPLAAVGLVIVLAVIVLIVMARRRPLEGGAAPRLMMRLPVIGRLRLLRALATHASALAALLARQVPLDDALALSAAVIEDPEVRSRAGAAAKAAEDGAGLADALQTSHLISPSLGWLVAPAEERGEGAAAVREVARIHAQRLERASERVSTFVGPALEVAVGIVVLLMAYSFIVPLFRMATQLLYARG